MEIQKKIASFLLGAISSGKISFHTGLKLFRPIADFAARDKTPAGRFIKRQNMGHILDATAAGSKTAWTSVLFPAEILYPFDLKPLTLEVMVGTFSTLGLSSQFLDSADGMDVPKTMCSFHRALLGMSRAGILKEPMLVGATSLMCDGNVKSFAEVARENKVPFIFIDVPFAEEGGAVEYVMDQINFAFNILSESSGVNLNQERLGETVADANRAIALAKKLYKMRIEGGRHVLRSHEQANFAFPLHFLLGSPRLVKMIEKCVDTIGDNKSLVPQKGSPMRVMWLHIVPQYKTPIWDIIDDGERARVICDEYSNPYFDEYDANDPARSIAERLLRHPSNGPIERRIGHILKIARDFKVDAIVHYSSWGCHQASGNIGLLEKAIRGAGYRFLNLNGDAADSRNSSFEQHRTRLEAMIENTVRI